jgi:hypothetical protein
LHRIALHYIARKEQVSKQGARQPACLPMAMCCVFFLAICCLAIAPSLLCFEGLQEGPYGVMELADAIDTCTVCERDWSDTIRSKH